jgi:3-hydroxyisobutyrate dehydrogenase
MTAGRLRVGFVGVGNQGGPMAGRILDAGFPLTLWARRPLALDDYPGAGKAADLAGLAAASEIIGVCVLDDAATIEVFDGLLPGLRPGAVVMIHSTIHPDTCRALAGRAAQAGAALIDAPVSGGAEVARAGRLTVMCGGDEAVIQRCRPVIDSFAALVLRMGAVGAGQETKLINNALMAANMGLAHEAVGLGRSIGIDPAALNQVIAASSGRSLGHDAYARLGSPRDFVRGALLLRKDVNLLAKVAETAGVGADQLFGAADRFLTEAEKPA